MYIYNDIVEEAIKFISLSISVFYDYILYTKNTTLLTSICSMQIGTYNALIGDTELYKASESDFSDSHKLFKRALRTFSWEVLEVYSGPPTVAFKWRHWGTMVGDLKVNLGNGKKLEAEATNEVVDTFGVTVAKVNEKFEIEQLETFYDPSDLLRKMAKKRKDNNDEATTGNTSKCPFAASAPAQ